jgi:hypothetical protein
MMKAERYKDASAKHSRKGPKKKSPIIYAVGSIGMAKEAMSL